MILASEAAWLVMEPEALGYHSFGLDLSCVDCGCSWPCEPYTTTLVRVFGGDVAGVREFMSQLASGLADRFPGMTGEQVKRRLCGWIPYECGIVDRPTTLVEMAEYLEATAALEGLTV